MLSAVQQSTAICTSVSLGCSHMEISPFRRAMLGKKPASRHMRMSKVMELNCRRMEVNDERKEDGCCNRPTSGIWWYYFNGMQISVTSFERSKRNLMDYILSVNGWIIGIDLACACMFVHAFEAASFPSLAFIKFSSHISSLLFLLWFLLFTSFSSVYSSAVSASQPWTIMFYLWQHHTSNFPPL